jgi:hypothetical protein
VRGSDDGPGPSSFWRRALQCQPVVVRYSWAVPWARNLHGAALAFAGGSPALGLARAAEGDDDRADDAGDGEEAAEQASSASWLLSGRRARRRRWSGGRRARIRLGRGWWWSRLLWECEARRGASVVAVVAAALAIVVAAVLVRAAAVGLHRTGHQHHGYRQASRQTASR